MNSDLSGGSTQSSPLSAASLQTSFVAPNSYGLSIQPNTNSQIASIQFDAATGWLAIAGNSANNIVKQTITGNGYYQFDIDGQLFSSDRSSASFWQSLEGATRDSLTGINFDGGLGYDTLIVGSLEHINNFAVIADDTIQIQGEVYGESLFFKAKDIINQGSITASNITAEFSNSYTDEASAKIIAIDGGNILLNGGKTGDLEATSQFLATGVTGGKIDFRGKAVSLRGATLDASGKKGGGTILIGGDYQGGDATGLGTLSNAQSVFVDKYSSISANALTSGNGGKVIIWSDLDTDFRGNVNVRGGAKSGDGGFVEVSGKQNLNFVGNVDVNATNGKQGSILLDPEDIIINPDDDDDSTFDVSNLQKIVGDITLSATNNITFNTNAYFQPSIGTLTLQAGGTVSLFGYLWAGLHDINITAGSIIADEHGAILSNPYSGNGRSGNIKLVSQREIDFGQTTILAESNSYSGNITLEAGTFITTGLLTAYGKNRGGNIKLTANGDIFTSSIRTFSAVSNGRGKGGNISIVSTNGSINTTNNDSYGNNGTSLYTAGLNGNSGSVTLEAYGDIITNEIKTASDNNGNGGNVKLTSLTGTINTSGKLITTSAAGNAGTVTLKSVADIKVGDIVSNSSAAGDVIFNGGAVTLTATDGNIEAGYITSGSNTGNAKNVIISAKGLTTDGVTTVRNIKVGDISANSSTGVGVIGSGGNVGLYASGNAESGNITTASNAGNAGNVRVEAVGNIVTNGLQSNSGSGNGGNIKLISKAGKVDTNGEQISTYSNSSNAGNVNLNAYLGINVGEINAYALVKAGEVRLQTNQDISTKLIYASSRSSDGNKISITSVNGGIDTNGGLIATTSSAGGNAGAITLKSAKDIKVGDVFARSRDGEIATTGVWNGGRVTFEADGNIETGNITTTSITGNAGNVTVKANLGSSVAGGLGIKVGNIDAFANGDGNAGDVKLTAGFDSDIKVLAIKTNVGGKGDGGETYITGGGNIVIDSVRADSIGGKAGNIRLIASKTVRVTSAFSVNGKSYSIYTDSVDDASGAKGGTVTIQHGSKISPFVVGDASENGTFAGVSDGVLGLVTKTGSVHRISGKYSFNNIKIIAPAPLASANPQINAANIKDETFLGYVFDRFDLFSRKATFLALGLPGFTLQQLKDIATDAPGGDQLPSLNESNARKLLNADLNFYLYLYGITTPRTKGHFIAQSLHETGSFKSFSETEGPGRGLIQLTLDENIDRFAAYIGVEGLSNNKDVISTNLSLNILSAMWFWSVFGKGGSEDLNAIAQNDSPNAVTVEKISRIVRGDFRDPNILIPTEAHLPLRIEYFDNAIKVLNIT
jgi:hypothetical protein